MTQPIRGAEILLRTLARAGTGTIFTLSGNHIMSVFDAAPAAGIELIHTRHEAAAVHMADAFARWAHWAAAPSRRSSRPAWPRRCARPA